VYGKKQSCAFFDAARVVSPSDDDGVHLDAGAHAAFGNAIAECVRKLI
jgi:lysophospholipase L1-like esterase